jgi:hypothetical protein
MSIENQTKENSCYINKDWTNDDILEKIVKYERGKMNKSKYVEEDIELLQKNHLMSLRDWKELCLRTTFSERRNVYHCGLVLLLDNVAGIEPIERDMEKADNFSLFDSVFHWVSNYFWLHDISRERKRK